jgi:transposase-like protein
MKRIERRAKTRKRRHTDDQARRAQQRRLQREIDEAILGLVSRHFEAALQVEVTELLGRCKGERRDESDVTVVEARCNRCGTQHRARFYRAGFYSRSLLTLDAWLRIDVPRVSCVCGGMVDFEFARLEPYGRIWFELEERARSLAGLCVSLRDSVEVLSWRNGQSVSIATLNGRVNQVADLAVAFHQGRFEKVPAVVMLDGVWLKVLMPTDEGYVDKHGRHRKRYKLRTYPLLVAYGIDPTSGRRSILDWERGEGEDEASWRRLLERLHERGLDAERGLRLFVHDGSAGLDQAFDLVWFGEAVERQRCIFHKLRNVRRDVLGEPEMNREQRKKRRQEVLKDATEVYRGKDEREIRRRLVRFRAKWEVTEPKAVATLERDFDRTLAYLKVLSTARREGQEWRVECLRTTSLLERVQRHFRQKARQVMIAHSEKGADASIELVIRRRGLASDDKQTESWTQLLEQALLAA